MKYPAICNWVTYKGMRDGNYVVYDELFDEPYRMSSQEFDFYRRLDGKTDPYSIQTDLTREQVEQLLAWLEAELLIRKSRILSSAFGKVVITIISTKNCGVKKRAAKVADRFLSALWLPVLLSAVFYLTRHYEAVTGSECIIAGSIFGLVVGTVGHECGHAIACLAHGGKVFEFGVGWFYIYPSAYVLLSMNAIRSRRKRGHVDAAGVEMNLLLTGVGLYLACLLPGVGGFFFYAAIQNAILALFNLLFVKGIDGLSIVSEYVGCEDLIQYAKEVIADEDKRHDLCHTGINGVVLWGVCYIALLMQVGLPLLIAVNLAFLFL